MTAESIYRRDKWTCQYCGLEAGRALLRGGRYR